MNVMDVWVDGKDGQTDRRFDKHAVSSGGGTQTFDPWNDEASALPHTYNIIVY
jgi:hypothetical protein